MNGVGGVTGSAARIAALCRRELQTMEVTLDTLGKHLDRARLGETGGTFNQQVTIAQQRNQHAVDQVCLADNKRARMSL